MELVVLLALTFGVIGLAGRLPEARRVKRELARTPRQSLDALEEGQTAIVHGRVRRVDDQTQLTAPISGRPCVFWCVTFEEVGIAGDFRELGRTDAGCPFLLEGRGATARVVPDGPRIALPGQVTLRPAALLDQQLTNDSVLRLARSVCKRPTYPQTSMLRATEFIVAPGMDVTIKGYCTREPDPTAAEDVTGYRTELPTRPVISGTRRVRLLIG